MRYPFVDLGFMSSMEPMYAVICRTDEEFQIFRANITSQHPEYVRGLNISAYWEAAGECDCGFDITYRLTEYNDKRVGYCRPNWYEDNGFALVKMSDLLKAPFRSNDRDISESDCDISVLYPDF